MSNSKEKREYQQQWRLQRRQDWINSQGGCCVECGSIERLEVDHINAELKTMSATSIWTRRQEVRDEELANCQVLCYDCHKKKTKKWYDDNRKHGTVHMYERFKCRCGPCKKAKSEKLFRLRSKN